MGTEEKTAKVAFPVKLLVAVFSFLLISVVLSLTVNPFEFIRFQRDRQRKEDLRKISLLIQEAESKSQQALFVEKKTVYISLPDLNPDCSSWISKGLPKIGAGFKYRCVAGVDLQKINGSGWLPINLNLLASASFDKLPIDPINGKRSKNPETGQTTLYFYQYIRGSFALGAFSELRPKVDEAYSSIKKQKITEALLGYSPIEIGVALGGRMISAGSIDLLLEANAPSLSAEEIKVSEDALKDAISEVSQVRNLISRRLTLPASQAILFSLDALGIETDPSFANQIISTFSDKTTQEYLKQSEELKPIAQEAEKPAPKESESKPKQSPPVSEKPKPKPEEPPPPPPSGPPCAEIEGYDKPIAVCGREAECLAGACGSNAVCDVCIVPN